MKKKIVLRYLFWFLSLFVMAMIFYFSGQNAEQSTRSSGRVTELIVQIINPEYKNLPKTEQLQALNNVSGIIRTMGHFFEYFLLCLFVISSLMTYNIKVLKIILTGALICGLYALSDEIHQLFISGRACEFFDMMIDIAGIFTGTGFIFLITKIFKIKKGL